MTHVRSYQETRNGKVITVPEHDDKRAAAKQRFTHQRIALGEHRDGTHYVRAASAKDAKAIHRASKELGLKYEHRKAEAIHDGVRAKYHHFHFDNAKDAERLHDHFHSQAIAKDSAGTFGKKNHQRNRADYAANPATLGGRKLDVDEARELVKSYRENRTIGAAIVHEDASSFVKGMWKDRMDPRKNPIEPDLDEHGQVQYNPDGSIKGKDEYVMILAGGGGSGKGTASKMLQLEDHANTIWDGVMGNLDKAKQKIDEALASGRRVEYAFIYRPIEDSVDGMVGRAHTGSGRIVHLDHLAEAHKGALEVAMQFLKDYKDNENVHIQIVDNSHGFGKAKVVPHDEQLNFLKGKAYDNTVGDRVENAYNSILENGYEHKDGTRLPVSEKVREALDKTRPNRKKPAVDAGSPTGQGRGASADPQRNSQALGGGNRSRTDEERAEDDRKGVGRARPIQKAHVKGHIRVIDGHVVWIKDHETKRQGRAAKLHERTTMGQHKTLGTYLRASDGEDAREITRAAARLGIQTRQTRAQAVHHGQVGRFDHIHFDKPEDAAAVLGELANVPDQAEEITPNLFDAVEAPEPKPEGKSGFDAEDWDRSRAEKVQASRASGNTHLDQIPFGVEAMRGKRIAYVHNPEEVGTISTVTNDGHIFVKWTGGPQKGTESSITRHDAKDYIAKPGTSGTEKYREQKAKAPDTSEALARRKEYAGDAKPGDEIVHHGSVGTLNENYEWVTDKTKAPLGSTREINSESYTRALHAWGHPTPHFPGETRDEPGWWLTSEVTTGADGKPRHEWPSPDADRSAPAPASATPAEPEGAKPGDTMEKGGKTYVLNQNHRWELSSHDKAVSHNAHKIKVEERRDRLENAADRASRESTAAYNRSSQLGEAFYMGQPILVGHHSEKAARNRQAKMHNAMDKSVAKQKEAADLSDRAAGVGTAGISSDDASAVDQLRTKLTKLETERDAMKAINAAHKKFLKDPASLDKSELPESYKKVIRDYKPQYSWEPHPIPPYRLTNMAGKINATKKRIEELEKETHRRATMDESALEQTWTLDGEEVTVTEDHDENKIEVDFGRRRIPTEQYELMQSRGFHHNHSRRGTIFTRKLNDNSRAWAEQTLEAMGATKQETQAEPDPDGPGGGAPEPAGFDSETDPRVPKWDTAIQEKYSGWGGVKAKDLDDIFQTTPLNDLDDFAARGAELNPFLAQKIAAAVDLVKRGLPPDTKYSPKVGDTRRINGITYRLNENHRWEREDAPAMPSDLPGVETETGASEAQEAPAPPASTEPEGQVADPRPGNYYVSAMDGPKHWKIAGPFPTHQEALDKVDQVRKLAEKQDPKAIWMAWGTCRTEVDDPRKTPMGTLEPETPPEPPTPPRPKKKRQPKETGLPPQKIPLYSAGIAAYTAREPFHKQLAQANGDQQRIQKEIDAWHEAQWPDGYTTSIYEPGGFRGQDTVVLVSPEGREIAYPLTMDEARERAWDDAGQATPDAPPELIAKMDDARARAAAASKGMDQADATARAAYGDDPAPTEEPAAAPAPKPSNKSTKMTYARAVKENLEHMGTPREEWKACPVKNFAETADDKGRSRMMPEFEFPQGYAEAPTMYKSDSSSGCCGLCGTTIKNVYWLQNDKKKWTLPVGSECVTHFEEGKSGEQLTAEAKHKMNLDLFQSALDARERLVEAFTTKNYKIHRDKRDKNSDPRAFYPQFAHWTNHEAMTLYRKIHTLTTTGAYQDYSNTPAAMTKWAKEHKDASAELIRQVDEMAPVKAAAPAPEEGPKDGDRNEVGLVFHGGRWHREQDLAKLQELQNRARLMEGNIHRAVQGLSGTLRPEDVPMLKEKLAAVQAEIAGMEGTEAVGDKTTPTETAPDVPEANFGNTHETPAAQEEAPPQQGKSIYTVKRWKMTPGAYSGTAALPVNVEASSPEEALEIAKAKGQLEHLKDGESTSFEVDPRYTAVRDSKDATDLYRGAEVLTGDDAPAPLTFETQNELASRIRKGEITPEELVAEWERFKAARPALQAELEGMSKAKMIERLKGLFRIDPKTKATQKEIVKGVLSSMGDGYQVQGTFSWSPFTETHDQAMDRVIQATTAEQIAEHAVKVAESNERRKAEREQIRKAIDNPETLEEFNLRARYKAPDLTPEQKRRWEDLQADARRAATAPKDSPVQAVALNDVAMELHESKHTKTGAPLWVVTMSQRVERDLYEKLNGRAKQLGGYYSSFRGNGAIPGFTFKDPEQAKAFMATEETQAPAKSVEERVAEKKAAVGSKLRTMADGMIEKADDELNRDRRTNTRRQSEQAASSIANAEGQKAMAQTMLNLADAIEDGRAKHLGGLKARTQIEELNSVLRLAKSAHDEAQEKAGGRRIQWEESVARPTTIDDVDHAKYPYPALHHEHVTRMGIDLANLPGLSRAAAKLAAMRPEPGKTSIFFDTPEKIQLLVNVSEKLEKWKDARRDYAWMKDRVKSELLSYHRLQSAGIETPEQLRAALREYLVYKTMAKGEDPIKAAERSLVGAKIPGYFPTPDTLADEVIDKAALAPGMKVLEPSAGKGSLIDALHRAHGKDFDVDAIEPVESLRTILGAKGHNVVGRDILEHHPGPIYDRVVMNPPFENGQDMEHTRAAFDLLKPGGRLVAITSPGPYFRSDKKSQAFREWLDEMGAVYEPNPEGSFKESGTDVNTYTVVIDKPSTQENVA